MLVGYMRVSTAEQSLALQRDALLAAQYRVARAQAFRTWAEITGVAAAA